MRVHYLCACYFGDRRTGGVHYDADRLAFLRLHVGRLWSLRHEVALFSFVLNGSTPAGWAWPSHINGAPVRVVERVNHHGSYGAWNQGLREMAGTGYDYHICVEDDYVPGVHHFDRWLVDRMMEQHFGALYQHYSDDNIGHPHPAISNGILWDEAVRAVIARHGDMVEFDPLRYSHYEHIEKCQIVWADRIVELGYRVESMLKVGASTRFWGHDGKLDVVKRYGRESDPEMFVPAQILLGDIRCA